MKRQIVNTRALTSLLLVWMFLVLLVSGVVLYLAPPGRIAHWTHWRLLGLTKEAWQAVHTVSSLVFVVGGLLHLLKFNWGAVTSYLRRSRQGHPAFFGSVIASAAIAAVVIVGTVAEVPPFVSVMDLGREASASWAEPAEGPPVPHLEEASLTDVAHRFGIEPAEAVRHLAARGVEVTDPSASLRQIAERARTSPAHLYRILTAAIPESATAGTRGPMATIQPLRSGWGRLRLAEAAARLGITPDEAVRRLRAAGIEATRNERVREVAERAGISPLELVRRLAPGTGDAEVAPGPSTR